jgi:DNA-binding transcriptional LysR family regulator
VTDAVKALEARLGVRLLQRTTRQVSPTLDGEAYYQRCVSLIADMEEAEGAFAGAKPSGLIRIGTKVFEVAKQDTTIEEVTDHVIRT